MGGKTGGVEIRETSIRIQFRWNGETCKETLREFGTTNPMKPTKANEAYAYRLIEEIKMKIRHGNFNYGEYFPDSQRAKNGLTPKQAHNTFGKLAEQYKISIGNLKPATKNQYTNAANFWKRMPIQVDEKTVKPMEELSMKEITFPMLKITIGGYPWKSAKSKNNYLIPLRGIFALEYYGVREPENPLIPIKNEKPPKKKPDPFTPEERDLILKYMKEKYDERVWAYFVFAFYTGMRPEELIALQWADFDSLTKTIRVKRVRTFRGTERDGSKTDEERDVHLVQAALDALAVMKKYTFMKQPKSGDSPDIFEHPETLRPWHDERAQRDTYFKPALRALGIRYRRAYATRHAFATAALIKGVNPSYIARQLGHSNSKMVHEKYALWIDGADGGTEREKLETALSNAKNPIALSNRAFS